MQVILYLLLISVVNLPADVLFKLSIIIDKLLSDDSVECVCAADDVAQFIDMLCSQIEKCPIPFVAEILNLVVNFSTVGNQVDNLVVNFTVVGYILQIGR